LSNADKRAVGFILALELATLIAFDKLKWVFTTKPVLAAPDLDKEFRVEADTSNYATGEVLSMKCSDKVWRPVAFISKSLSDTERNYEIHDKEMLAVVRCLEV